MLDPLLDGRVGARGDRHEPLLTAFAADHQKGLAWPNCRARQADQFACTQTRSVEKLEQGEVAHSRGLAACGAALGGFEHALDLPLVENAGKRAFEPRARKRL